MGADLTKDIKEVIGIPTIEKTRGITYFAIGAIGIVLLIILYLIGKQMVVPLQIFNENEKEEINTKLK